MCEIFSLLKILFQYHFFFSSWYPIDMTISTVYMIPQVTKILFVYLVYFNKFTQAIYPLSSTLFFYWTYPDSVCVCVFFTCKFYYYHLDIFYNFYLFVHILKICFKRISIAFWSIFMMAALILSSNNSDTWFILVLANALLCFLIQVVIFLFLSLTNDFPFYPEPFFIFYYKTLI